MSNFIVDEIGIHISANSAKVSYPEASNDKYFEIENNSFWFDHRNKVLTDIIRHYPFQGAYADIGGGNGFQAYYLSKEFPDKEFYLIEPGYGGCKNGRRRGLQNVYNCLYKDFDFKARDVRGVSLLDVIEHIEDHVGFLKRLVDMTASGSMFYIAVPAYQWLWNDIDELGGHFRRYNRESLLRLGVDAGLQSEYFTYFFSYVPLPTLFLRTFPYRLGRRMPYDKFLQVEAQMHKTGALTKSILSRIHGWELHRIQQQKTIPHGGSCIAVFKKP